MPLVAPSQQKDETSIKKSFKNAKEQPLINFLSYQRAWLEDKSRFKIGMWARQTGKSLTQSAEIAEDVLENPGTLWLLISAGEAQAKELIHTVGGLLELTNVVYESVSEQIGATLTETINKHTITLKNGSRIISVAANPDTIRGYSGNVYWDEAAIGKNSAEMWRAILPIISNDYKIRLTSTPQGKQGRFYQIMTDTDKLWSRHVVNIEKAVEQGLERNLEELKIAAGDEDTWRQEYLLEWLDEAHSWLSFDLIMACEDDNVKDGAISILYDDSNTHQHKASGSPLINNKGMFFIGIDIARRRDLWVAVVLEKIGDVLWTRELLTQKNITFGKQETILDSLVQYYNPIHMIIDQTGMGEQFTERAQQEYGESRVEGMLFSAALKLKIASIMKQKFQDRTIRIPKANFALRSDLHAVKKQQSTSDVPLLKDDGSSDGHADRFWALALAISAAETIPQEIDFDIIPRNSTEIREAYLDGY